MSDEKSLGFQESTKGWMERMFATRYRAEDFLPPEEEREALARAGLVRIPLDVPFQVEPVNVVLMLGDPPALIDTGMRFAESLSQLEQALAGYGLQWGDIGEIWLTHPHLDHFGLAGDISKLSGGQVGAWQHSAFRFEEYIEHWHRDREAYLAFLESAGVDPSWIEESRNSPSHFHEMAGAVTIQRTIAAQEGLWMAGRHRAILLHLPGHSPWCTAFWLEDAGILVGGDVLLQRMPSNPVFYPEDVSPVEWQGLDTYARSLQRVLQLPVDRIIPGHGFSFTEHQKVASRAILRLEQRRHRIRDMLQGREMTAYDVAEAVFTTTLVRKALFLVMSETLRHLEWLVSLGEIRSHVRGKQVVYGWA